MFKTKRLATNTRPLPLHVDDFTFTEEWILCAESIERDRTLLIQMLEPVIEHWINLITEPSYPKDVTFMSLYSAIQGRALNEYEDPLKYWIAYQGSKKEIRQQLICIWLNVLNKMDTDTLLPGAYTEFTIATCFRWELQDSIKAIYLRERNKLDINDMINHDYLLYRDVLFIKNARLDKWQEYLLLLLYNGYCGMDIECLTNYAKTSLYKEIEILWTQLKSLYFRD
jgi:hypothetical protein